MKKDEEDHDPQRPCRYSRASKSETERSDSFLNLESAHSHRRATECCARTVSSRGELIS